MFSIENPDAGGGDCLWCVEEQAYPPALLARMRAEGDLVGLLSAEL